MNRRNFTKGLIGASLGSALSTLGQSNPLILEDDGTAKVVHLTVWETAKWGLCDIPKGVVALTVTTVEVVLQLDENGCIIGGSTGESAAREVCRMSLSEFYKRNEGWVM